MNEKVGVNTKTRDAKRKSFISKKQNGDFSKTEHIPFDQTLFLQRNLGNEALQRMMESGAVRAKLKIGQPNDKYEQEADHVADQVMRMVKPGIQRQSTCPGCPEKEEIQTKPVAEQITPLVQRQEEGKEEMLQPSWIPQKGNSPQDTSVGLEESIHNTRSGIPLPDSTRDFMESRFGMNFSAVRIHAGANSTQMNQQLSAKAFTLGNNLYFNEGQYNPNTSSGKQLLAHELTHKVQQGNSLSKTIQKQNIPSATPTASGGKLAYGQVVYIEVRASGRIDDMSHEYPIDVNGFVKLPMLGLVRANGLTPFKLSSNIEAALVNGQFFRKPTVNVTLTKKIVAYGALISFTPVYMRLLSRGGTIQPESGSYPVYKNGTINLPYVGIIRASKRRLDVVESEIQAGYRNKYIKKAIVHLTKQSLS